MTLCHVQCHVHGIAFRDSLSKIKWHCTMSWHCNCTCKSLYSHKLMYSRRPAHLSPVRESMHARAMNSFVEDPWSWCAHELFRLMHVCTVVLYNYVMYMSQTLYRYAWIMTMSLSRSWHYHRLLKSASWSLECGLAAPGGAGAPMATGPHLLRFISFRVYDLGYLKGFVNYYAIVIILLHHWQHLREGLQHGLMVGG